MSTAFTTSAAVIALAGQRSIDLRADDAEPDDLMDRAIEHGSAEIDWYMQDKYQASALAESRFITEAATAFALEYWCLHRLNESPKSLTEYADRYREKLQLVLEGRAGVPGVARSRRPVTVTNQTTDLRRPNNQIRTDRTRSTGVAQGYVRPTDPNAPDCR